MKNALLKFSLVLLDLCFVSACTSTKYSQSQAVDTVAEASVNADEVDVAIATDDVDSDTGDWNEDYQ